MRKLTIFRVEIGVKWANLAGNQLFWGEIPLYWGE